MVDELINAHGEAMPKGVRRGLANSHRPGEALEQIG
jgi:hypothetical protein